MPGGCHQVRLDTFSTGMTLTLGSVDVEAMWGQMPKASPFFGRRIPSPPVPRRGSWKSSPPAQSGHWEVKKL
jgi:hypothetical protein